MARKAKQPKGKRMNPTFFVFCEGKTAAAYVDLLRRNFRVPVEIIARVSDSNISQPYIDRWAYVGGVEVETAAEFINTPVGIAAVTFSRIGSTRAFVKKRVQHAFFAITL